jgi:hypothetical protein
MQMTRMPTISTVLPRIDLLRHPAAKSQQPAHTSRSAFLVPLSQLPVPRSQVEDMPVDTGTDNMDDGTNNFTDHFTDHGAGTSSSVPNNPRSFAPAALVPSKRGNALQNEVSSGSKRAKLDNITSKSRPSDISTPVPPKEKKVAQFAVGYASGGKPKTADYEDVVQALLIHAMHEYESRIVGISPYPDSAIQSKWAKICWKEACSVAVEDYCMTERMSKMVCHGVSFRT